MQFNAIPLWGGLCLLFSAGAATAQAPANTFAASTNHSACIRPDGSLWTWGMNLQGQLGNGTTTGSPAPVQVLPDAPDTHWAQVAAGISHTLAITTDGRLYAWGCNHEGQLGDGTTTSHESPVAIEVPGTAHTSWKQVAAGSSHSLALTADGRLYTWGINTNGQLGNGLARDCTTPIEVPLPASAATTTWAQVAAGNDHTLALTADGRLFAWGGNLHGQLGNGTNNSTPQPVAVALPRGRGGAHWAQVAAGRYHTLAVTTDGRLYTWGSNRFGQLGETRDTGHNAPEMLAMPARLAHMAWAQVAAGDAHSLALSADGQLAAWGNNCAGQLGNGTTTARFRPVAVARPQASAAWTGIASGGFHTLALTKDGQLCTWGCNCFGQLGNGTTTNHNRPQNPETPTSSRVQPNAADGLSLAPTGRVSLPHKSRY
ncbi:RCC1 domain-containing protein [Hymenobacter terricola]|uniref:RCC1 domain-containing protein n=1 Tax=Hymenobacter terricola TaxID=2819236 RepID=UPI001B317287|nr:hypothetical protein [Hymenobacter terricola]